MAYVNFWKGLAANYSAETHAEGIYQCTDTGNTYIFGVLNSGTAGDSNVITLDLSTDLANGDGTLTDEVINKLKDCGQNKKILIIRRGDNTYQVVDYAFVDSDPTGMTIVQGLIPITNVGDKISSIQYFIYAVDFTDKTITSHTQSPLPFFKVLGDGTKFLNDAGQYVSVPESPFLLVKDGDPLYFEPESSLETLQALTFPNVNTEYVDSLYLSNKVVVMDNDNAQGTFGDGIHRYTVFHHVVSDSNLNGEVVFEWIYNNLLRKLSIKCGDTSNTVTVTETDLTPQTVDLSGYKKIEEVSALPSSPDADTLYVIPESTGSEEGGGGTFG